MYIYINIILYNIISHQHIFETTFAKDLCISIHLLHIHLLEKTCPIFSPQSSLLKRSRATFRLHRIPCRKTEDADQRPCTSRHWEIPCGTFQLASWALPSWRRWFTNDYPTKKKPESWCLENDWFPFEMVLFFVWTCSFSVKSDEEWNKSTSKL